MPLERGTWYIDENGDEGTLRIAAIDAQGNVTGTVFGEQIEGFWDENLQRIMFVRMPDPADKSTFKIYTGYLFTISHPLPPSAEAVLAGHFEAFQGGGGAAQRSLFGWVAHLGHPVGVAFPLVPASHPEDAGLEHWIGVDVYINANGYEGPLRIAAIDAQGNVAGTVFGEQIEGFWDENLQRIIFMRMTNPADKSTFQIYTGYPFMRKQIDPTSTTTTATLTGHFEAFQGGGGAAQRSLFGWVAGFNVQTGIF
jgi:hypothetical protein